MENADNTGKSGFAGFASKRIIIVVLLVIIGLWLFVQLLGLFKKPSPSSAEQPASHDTSVAVETHGGDHDHPNMVSHTEKKAEVKKIQQASPHTASQTVGHGATVAKTVETDKGHSGHAAISKAPRAKGVAFVEAVIKPINHEVNERFWGWRPNDIIRFTDNVNNFQLGVLEVTRRTSVTLAERISRTGATAAFDPNLEQAMNWFMIKADRYMLPSAESKYQEGVKELKAYLEKLKKGTASFYTRNDNLIPLLASYEDLLGSCEENLVKDHEENGDPVGHFMADDYFYYAKGVASALATILEAVQEDFAETVEARRGTDVLHHVVEACQRTIDINPIYITNSSLDGILANHRANMAAPISHARFYLGVLIKTLST